MYKSITKQNYYWDILHFWSYFVTYVRIIIYCSHLLFISPTLNTKDFSKITLYEETFYIFLLRNHNHLH